MKRALLALSLLAALPFACLTAAGGTALGYTVAARVRQSVRQSVASKKDTPMPALSPSV